ncbi:hypothetical protein FFZ30_0068 [Salmonella phage DaR-2019a]|nr:hypothetical protein FFZ30_0068 [Salmonella phage DaR-2019a]
MNYELIYNAIIKKAHSERGVPLTYYKCQGKGYERHHIIPVCLGGDKISGDNIALLTPREHYIAHKLLVKMYPNNHKLWFAWHRLAHDGLDRKISSRDYEKVRALNSKALSIVNKGRVFTEEHRRRLGESQIGNTKSKGCKRSIETRKKMSEAGKKPKEKKTCPHCGMTGGAGNMTRYHFDNCKKNNLM